MNTAPDMNPYTGTDFQVWVQEPSGAFYVYRDDARTSRDAQNWAAAWTETNPTDVQYGSTFHAVKATTTYAIIR
jgi:hypothetical protein